MQCNYQGPNQHCENVPYKREFVITEFVITEFDCIFDVLVIDYFDSRCFRQLMFLTVDYFDNRCFKSWCFCNRCSRSRCFGGAPNQTTLNALNNAATVVYEAVYEAASYAISEVDASHFHELSQKFNQPQMKNKLFIKNQNSESENVQCMIFLL